MQTAKLISIFLVLIFIISCENSTIRGKKESPSIVYSEVEGMAGAEPPDEASSPPPTVVPKGHSISPMAEVTMSSVKDEKSKYGLEST